MKSIAERWEQKVVDALYDGDMLLSDLARKVKLSTGTVRQILGTLIVCGEVEVREVPDRSGDKGRLKTLYGLAYTKKAA